MLSEAQWSVSGPEEGRLTLSFHGALDDLDHTSVERDALYALDGIEPEDAVCLVVLDGLDRVSQKARLGLVQMQRTLGKRLRRTAYVSQRPLFRGVALWIMHRAPDTNARSFQSQEIALSWLTGREHFNRHEEQKKKAYQLWDAYQQRKSAKGGR